MTINNVIKNLQNSNSNHKPYDNDDFLITEFKIDYNIYISLMVINLKLI